MISVKELIARNRASEAIGLPCFCTANEAVLRAILQYVAKTGYPTIIEATCNQVNQEGGYTDMTPQHYMTWLAELASDAGVAKEQLILGGDHLGPNPWKSEPLDKAMEKARELVKQYVEAGFTKIHLDASMACGGEPNPSFAQIAERAAELCEVAETYAPDPDRLMYIIGTEVPIPGGETEEPDALDVTSVARFHDTLTTHREAFSARGLEKAWGRIVSAVTQPGVDFGHTSIYPFQPEKSKKLSDAILDAPDLTFEAHSTDYQSNQALAALVQQHFFFLKVGPELTFRFREALGALSLIERHIGDGSQPPLFDLLDAQMQAHPQHWQEYYSGSSEDMRKLRLFSYSDRIRYYWGDPVVAEAVDRLMNTLQGISLPETIVSQAFMGLEFGAISDNASELLQQHIQKCVKRYFDACGYSQVAVH